MQSIHCKRYKILPDSVCVFIESDTIVCMHLWSRLCKMEENAAPKLYLHIVVQIYCHANLCIAFIETIREGLLQRRFATLFHMHVNPIKLEGVIAIVKIIQKKLQLFDHQSIEDTTLWQSEHIMLPLCKH